MKTFAISDIHGQYETLVQVLEKSGIDKEKDRLIVLGDTFDRGDKPVECIRLLSEFKNLVYLMGNHDQWTLDWLTGEMERMMEGHWFQQGGFPTVNSVMKHRAGPEIIRFLGKALYYFEDNNRLFVHAGFDTSYLIDGQPRHNLIWDRELIDQAANGSLSLEYVDYDEIYIGHTPTIFYNEVVPTKFGKVWAIDTGAAYGNKLSIINVDTKEYFQA